jgi:hypothetical protein
MTRKRPIYASDVRCLGGVVAVQSARDRVDAEGFFVISHLSRGGDVAFQSGPIRDADQADVAARVRADFTGATVSR